MCKECDVVGRPRYCDVKCPFFVKWTTTSVTCEGIMWARCTSQTFSDSADKDFFVKHNCCEINPRCEVYRLLQKKYKK